MATGKILTLLNQAHHAQKDPRLAEDLNRIVEAIQKLQQTAATTASSTKT